MIRLSAKNYEASCVLLNPKATEWVFNAFYEKREKTIPFGMDSNGRESCNK